MCACQLGGALLALQGQHTRLLGGRGHAGAAGGPGRARARAQSWEDEDMPALLEDLGGALADNIRLLSSWDKYKKEVLSGSLDWTPMHTSDAFWAENAPHFEERDFQARAGRVGCVRIPVLP